MFKHFSQFLVGTIGMGLLDLISTYVCSDENPNNLQCFNNTVKELPKAFKGKVQPYHQKGATQMVSGKGLAFSFTDKRKVSS